MTVLFADIKGSLAMLSGRDPEDARAVLDPILEYMVEAVHAFDGTVSQVMGDGIMALFGAPLSLEDHALRAGCAALRMLERVTQLGVASERPAPPVQLRIGINSGEVLVGSIGTDLGVDYTAIGETAHVAARLEQMASPGTALCSAATLRLAEGRLRARSLGALPVRGLPAPVEVAELVGVESSRLRIHNAGPRGLTPLVGRDGELTAIRQALERAAAGQGQVVTLVGEPGIGKSRLAWEISRSELLRDWLVVEGGGASYGAGMPYLPIRSLLQAYFAIRHEEPQAWAVARVTTALAALGADLAASAAPILALLELPVGETRWSALDAAQRRRETNEAVCRLLLRECESRPVLMIVEDLHWTDRETQALLEALVERLASRRLALLVNARPEYACSWPGEARCLELRLHPLSPLAKQALLAALLGEDAELAPAATAIAERTGGNPFFMEECVRALVEAGVLDGTPGHYRLLRSAPPVHVPATVQAVVAARIDRLPPEDKRLLQAAAALGPVFPAGMLAAMAGVAGFDLRSGLERLRASEFIYESRIFPELEYGFTHALTAEVAYAGMLQAQRRAMHTDIVAAIEARYGSRMDEHADRLGYHAHRGELWAQSIGWARKAAAKAAARSAYREALAYLEQAQQAAARLPEDRALLELVYELLMEMRAVLFPLHQIERDLKNLELAEEIAERLADRSRLARVLTLKTRDLSILGQAQRAMECGQRAVGMAEETGDPELQVLADAYLGSVYVARGHYPLAVEILARCVAALRGEARLARFGLPGPAAVFFRVWLVTALTRLGQFERAAREADESLAVAEDADQPLARLVARYTKGFFLAHEGRLAEAVAELEQSLAMCATWRLPAWFSNIASVLGWALARSGRLPDGIAMMREAIAASVKVGGMVNHSSEVARLADALLRDGQLAEARSLAQRALALARQHEERGNEAIALHLLGEIELKEDPGRAAGRLALAQAAALARELGMPSPAMRS